MKSSKKLVFFGNERLSSGFDATGTPLLSSLMAAGYEIVAIVTHYKPGRSRRQRQLEVAEVAKHHGIPVLLPDHPRDITEKLREFHAEAAILAAYGKLVPQATIDIFPRGIINIHPSLLPRYRGPTPIEQAILDGATETGVSIMQLVKQMDAGPIFTQAPIALSGHETKAELTQSLLQLGAQLLSEHLEAILKGELTPQPQNEAEATYCQLIKKEDGIINWQKSAVQLEREIRAYAGWPGSHTQLFGQDLIIEKASVVNFTLKPGEVTNSSEGMLVGCKEQALLITSLRPSGRRSMSGADFLRGLRAP